MAECPACGKLISPPTVKCTKCGVEMHRGCAKKTMGKFYCKQHYREGKKMARYEKMAQMDALGQKAPKKLW
ncbi:MAG: hypothetical protein ACK4GQ_04730 [Candidatus Hadarchaeales archaeon]